MKLDRLSSTTQTLSPESRERARHVADETVLRVGAMEGVEGDRQRSLQQEISDFDQKDVGAFVGGELILAEILRPLAASPSPSSRCAPCNSAMRVTMDKPRPLPGCSW